MCRIQFDFSSVAQSSFHAAKGRADEAVALVVGAVGVHPAQAGVVEETEVTPQGEVVAVTPAAADHIGQGRYRCLARPSSLGSCPASAWWVTQPGVLGDEVQVGQHRGPHLSPGRRPLREGVVGPLGALGEFVNRAQRQSGVGLGFSLLRC